MDVVAIGQARSLVNSLRGANAAPLMTRLVNAHEDATLLVLGDSTGVYQSASDRRWPRLVADQLAARYPAWTVKVHVWDDASKTYPGGSVVTVQTGTGPRTLNIYNGSTSGQVPSYSVTNIATQAPVTPHLVIVNYGYNEGTTNYRPLQYALTRTLEDRFPQAGIICIAQPPQASGNAAYAADMSRKQQIIDLAGSEGYGLVNVTQAFLQTPDYATTLLEADGLHPKAAGSSLWASLVLAEMNAGLAAGASLPQRRPHRLWIPATAFLASEGSPTLAIGGPANSQVPLWSLPDGATSSITTVIDYPEHWSTIHLYVVWRFAAGSGYTGSNNVCRYELGTSRVPVSTPWVGTTGTFSYGAGTNYSSDIVSATSSNSGAFAHAFTRLKSDTNYAMRPLAWRLRRLGADAADTLAEAALVEGIFVERAS